MQQSEQGIVTINVFTVSPENQLQLIDLLRQVTRESITHAAGFLGATLYRSIDGTRVTMHAKWRSVADYEAMRRSGGSEQTLAAALALASFAPGMYEVVESFVAETRGPLDFRKAKAGE